jgi:hypothetical protein
MTKFDKAEQIKKYLTVLEESCRYLGRVEARKEYGDYTVNDSRFETHMYQDIRKYRALILESLEVE